MVDCKTTTNMRSSSNGPQPYKLSEQDVRQLYGGASLRGLQVPSQEEYLEGNQSSTQVEGKKPEQRWVSSGISDDLRNSGKL